MKGNSEDLCLKIKKLYNLKYLILSDGAKESRIFGEDSQITAIKNSKLSQLFAYGTGNAFAGAFLSAILNGKTQQEAHDLANKAAIEVCKHSKG